MCVKVSCYAGAHVAAGRKRVARFQSAVDSFNAQPNALFLTDVEHFAGRFKLLMDQFERENKEPARKSGREGELILSELDQLLENALEDKDKCLDAEEAK